MFNCDKCGECCRNLDKSPLYKNLHTGNGICIYLDGNLCSIYDSRPLLCRVDQFYNLMLKEKVDYKDYVSINKKYCEELRKIRRK